ncbi:MAG: peptidoglycan-binding protein [Ilumatobacteraceae bacterium]
MRRPLPTRRSWSTESSARRPGLARSTHLRDRCQLDVHLLVVGNLGDGTADPALRQHRFVGPRPAQLLLQVGASPSLVPYGATGRFFAATEAAVREFQAWVRANHSGSVVVDGIAGGQTWSWLARLSAAGTTATRASGSSSGSANTASTAAGDRPELSYGMFGPPVTEMQRMLLRIGSTELAPYGATGKYYRVTRAAVRDFQEMVQARYDASVAVDGVVGPQTWAWLIQLDPG